MCIRRSSDFYRKVQLESKKNTLCRRRQGNGISRLRPQMAPLTFIQTSSHASVVSQEHRSHVTSNSLNSQRLASYLSPSRCSWSTWFPHEMYPVGMIHLSAYEPDSDSIISNPGQYKIQKLYTLWSPILKESAIWLYLTVGKKRGLYLLYREGKWGKGEDNSFILRHQVK